MPQDAPGTIVDHMYAIRAARAFDGTRFLPDGATVVLDGDQILGVESGLSVDSGARG